MGRAGSTEGSSSSDDDAGLPTFASRDWVATAEGLAVRRPDVAVVGAPMDIATNDRAGARFGPRALRSSAYEPGTYHLDLQIEIFDHLEVVDYGDAICAHGMQEASHAAIRREP